LLHYLRSLDLILDASSPPLPYIILAGAREHRRRCRKIQQIGQVEFLKAEFNGIAKCDVNHDPNLCSINLCGRRDAKAAVVGLFRGCDQLLRYWGSKTSPSMNETAGAFEVLRKVLNFLARRTRSKRVTFAFGAR
jgi:hypothetical protein